MNKLQKELGRLTGAVQEKSGQLKQAESQLQAQEKKGITPQLVARVHAMEVESDTDLLTRVQTAKQHEDTRREVTKLEESKKTLDGQISQSEGSLKDLGGRIKTAGNTLDDLELRAKTFRQAVSTVTWFFSNGYHTEDLKRLKDGLDLIGVSKDPTLSTSRLIKALEDAGNLVQLGRQVEKTRTELETLVKNTEKVRGELEAIRGEVLRIIKAASTQATDLINKAGVDSASAIGSAQSVAIKEIDDLGSTSKTAIQVLANEARTSLNNAKQISGTMSSVLADATTASSTRFSEDTQKTLTNLEAEVKRILDVHLSGELATFHQDFEKWGDIMRRAGKLEREMTLAYSLLGTMEIPVLKDITVSVMALLQRRIYHWVEMRFSTASIHPSNDVCSKDSIFLAYRAYRMTAVFQFCAEELEKRAKEEGGLL